MDGQGSRGFQDILTKLDVLLIFVDDVIDVRVLIDQRDLSTTTVSRSKSQFFVSPRILGLLLDFLFAACFLVFGAQQTTHKQGKTGAKQAKSIFLLLASPVALLRVLRG